MKNSNITLGRVLLSTTICAVLLTFGACKQEQKVEDPTEVAEEQNEEKFESNDNRADDSEFLVAAAEMDMMVVALGKLTASKGLSKEVQKFGEMTVNDHTSAAGELKVFAEKLAVSLPMGLSEEGQESVKKLNEKAGRDFDQKYAEMIVDIHNDAVSRMEKAAENANDPGIKEWASTKLPSLKSHLELAKKLKESVK